jgi:uncharacterized membrane protein YphA (DoxX/SURF4 family)
LGFLRDQSRSFSLAHMAVAYFMAHAPKSFFPTINGGQLAILFCFVFLYLVFAGGGMWSADEQLARSHKHWPAGLQQR